MLNSDAPGDAADRVERIAGRRGRTEASSGRNDDSTGRRREAPGPAPRLAGGIRARAWCLGIDHDVDVPSAELGVDDLALEGNRSCGDVRSRRQQIYVLRPQPHRDGAAVEVASASAPTRLATHVQRSSAYSLTSRFDMPMNAAT